MARAQSRFLTDHEEIRRWAEQRGATPACVRGTGDDGDVGMLRLDFPGYGGADSLQHVTWDEWLNKFDERKLALLVQEGTARSNFNKLVSRKTAQVERAASARKARGARAKTSGKAATRASRKRTAKGRTAAKSAAASRTRASAADKGSRRSTRGSTRAKRTESARGRTESRRKAA